MASVEETEIMGNLLTELENITKEIDSFEVRAKIQNIINKFDEVLC